MAEIIKMCALIDLEFFKTLKINNINSLQNNERLFYSLVKKNIKHKIDVITLDVKDSGFRNILNFGHTVGHAIESLEAFNISHGKSVSIGLCAEVQLATLMKKTPENVLLEIKDILENYSLPTEIPPYILCNIHDLIEKFKTDKKNNNENIRFIYIKEIGKIKEQNSFFLSLEKPFLLKFFSKRIYIDNDKDLSLQNNFESNNDFEKEEEEKILEKKIIKLKGSKSICNRAIILAALGQGDIILENFLFSEDTIVMIKCLKQLGIEITILNEDSILVAGKGIENFKNKNVKLFVENAGTAARFLTGFCLLFKNSIITIDGIERMRERPIDDLLDCILDTQEYKTKNEVNFKYYNDLFNIDDYIFRLFTEKNFNFEFFNDSENIAFEKDNFNKIMLKNNFEIIYLKQNKKMPFTIVTSSCGFELNNDNKIKLKSKKSSQFVSSLLLIFPFIKINNYKKFDNKNADKNKNPEIILTDLEEIIIENSKDDLKPIKEYKKPVSYQYIDMTLKMMEIWGIRVKYNPEVMEKFTLERYNDKNIENNIFSYKNPSSYKIEPDASTANFYLAQIALNGGNILLDSIGKKSIQGDSKFIEFIKKIRNDLIECKIEDHSISIKGKKFNSKNFTNQQKIREEKGEKNQIIIFDEDISIITDSFLALGVVCSQIPGEYYFRGIENQAIKECNRLEIFCDNLNMIGVFCSILPKSDGIYINSTEEYVRKNNINFVQINTENDHRVAMAFAILGKYLNKTKIYIDNKNCVNKTYPEFWNDFENLFELKYSADEFNLNRSVYKIYSESYTNKPVFLVGMRSCGKTSFGKIAAINLDLNFYDLDDILIEKYKGEFSSIKDMVEKKGWEYFRSLERKLFLEIYSNSYKYSRSIIACGGGIVENKDILNALRKTGNVIFIDTPLENIEKYLKIIDEIKAFQKIKLEKEENKISSNIYEDRRPAFNEKDFKIIYEERYPKYKYVSKFTFKTPFINDLNNIIDLFETYKNKEVIENKKDYSDLIEKKIEYAIDNFKNIVKLIGEIFTNFVFTTCNPMRFPVPHDNSYFLCAQVNETLLNKILLIKRLFNNMFLPKNLFENILNHKIDENYLHEKCNFTEKEVDEIKKFIKINFSQYNAVELRFDYLLQKIFIEKNNETINYINEVYLMNNSNVKSTYITLDQISNLFACIIQDFRYITLNKTPILFTVRSNDQGGLYNSKLYLKEYNSINTNILKYGIEYIDLEFRKENINFIEQFYQKTKEFNTSVILSNHFVEKENKNNLNFMKKSVFTMSLLNCDIIKIISNFDNFSANKKEFLEINLFIKGLIKKPTIFFQMGEADGKMTRLQNNYFLPVYNENLSLPTGKGQLNLDEITKLRILFDQDKQKILEYKVIGTNVTYSPSPKIYESCIKNLKINKKFETDFLVDFSFQNINFDDYLKKINSENQNKKIIEKSIFEPSEFYNVIFSEKLIFASITIPFKILLIDLFYDRNKITNKILINDSENKSLETINRNKLQFSEESLIMNSVNCIKKVNKNNIVCYNTDWIGNYEIIVELLGKLNKDLCDIKILVLGAGGAANAIIFSLKQFKFSNENIYIANRTEEKAISLARKFNVNIFFEKKKEDLLERKIIYDIVISTVPKDCELIFLYSIIDFVNENTFLLDLAYTRPNLNLTTNFKNILGAKSNNYLDGILFLLKQAYFSFELFYSKICPRSQINHEFLLKQ